MKLKTIISGGQTGADIGGLRAARKKGIRTNGYIPKGYMTEDDPKPHYSNKYGLQQYGEGYLLRTEGNVILADATLWFGNPSSRGSAATHRYCKQHKKPIHIVCGYNKEEVKRIATLVRKCRVINIAGNRESKNPGIAKQVKKFVCRLIDELERRH